MEQERHGSKVNEKQEKQNIFQRTICIILFAGISVTAWASAFPLIKLGLTYFRIDGADTGSKMVFAGIRFLFAGLLVLLLAKVKKRDFHIQTRKEVAMLGLFGFVNTALHYFFFYMGLSFTSGARSAILDSLSTFLLIVLACVFFKEEHMTRKKIVGCLLGFSGIIIVNMGSQQSGAFTILGDGMLILNAICAAFGGILTRIVTRKIDPLIATGASLSFGGALLLVAGILMGGRLNTISRKGLLVLVLLILVSAVAFSLYNQLLCYNPVGKIAIFNSMIPILGATLSCVILGEPFYLKYLLAGGLVMVGIYVVNRTEKE